MGEAAKEMKSYTYIPFTRIKGLSDRRRMPIIGKIRLGVKVNGARGMYPQETPYFVVPPEVARVYGEKPTELDVLFISNDTSKIFKQSLRWYGVTGLKCTGNNEQASRLDDQTYRYVPHVCPCDKLDTGECSARANLLVMLPKVPDSSAGLYQIDTSSKTTIENLNGYFAFLNITIGRFANVPMKLRRVPHLMRRQGQTETHYPLILRYEGTPEDTAALKADTDIVLKKLGTIEVQEPIDINPAADPEATVVAEEDLVRVMSLDNGEPASDPMNPNTPEVSEPNPPTVPATNPLPLAATNEKASPLPTPLVSRGAVSDQMSLAQHNKIRKMTASMNIATDYVDQITAGYTKRQASTLITQMIAGDYSAFDMMKEEEISVPPLLESTQSRTTAEF